MNRQQLGLVLLAGLALGSSAVMTRFGLREIPPLMLTMLRFATATIVYAITLVALRRNVPRPSRLWLDIALSGAASTGIPIILFTLALQFISTGVLTIIIALIPIFTGLLAHFWLTHEKLTWLKLLGLLLGFGGIALLIATRTTGLAQGGAADFRGHALALAGVLSAAVGAVYSRRRLREADAWLVSAGQMVASLLVVAPLALALSTLDTAAVTWRGWLVVLYTGLLGSFLAFFLIFLLIKRYGATAASLVGYIVPVVAGVLGVLLLGEVISAWLVVVGVLVLGGVVLSSR